MKLLVTGGLGFIGSNFILKILNEKQKNSVVNVDAELFGSNHQNLESVKNHENYRFVKGNITNRHLMEDLISECDAVVNFAAESFVDRSIADANPFLVSNIRGTFTILNIIKEQKKRLIQISTDEVFGSLESTTAKENSRFNPSSPYAATKAAANILPSNPKSITPDLSANKPAIAAKTNGVEILNVELSNDAISAKLSIMLLSLYLVY